ncbi:hypothetical protein BGX23_011281 [Mortierella sp. AD031]|nr:hypothetical protein BGX23_011281 [Mortierella sp. AD031]
MHSSIAFIFALALIFSIVTSPSSAQTSPCEKCIYDAVVQVQPACANIPYIGNMTSFDDSTWTSEQRACFCGLPACDSWYLHCAGPDKCDDFGFIFAYYAFFKIRRTPTCSSNMP